MANALTHKFVSAKLDGADATLLQPSDWNAEHLFAGGTDGQVLTYLDSATDNVSWSGVDFAGFNTTFGYHAGGYSGDGISHTYTGSVFIGHEAGLLVTTGTSNNFIGERTGYKTTTGHSNTAQGHGVLYENTTGTNNTAVGFLVGRENTSGEYNTYVGTDAGHDNQTGLQNTCLGANAGHDNLASYNTLVGGACGSNLTSATNTVFVGYNAGPAVVTGNQNVAVGAHTAAALTGGAGNTHVGYAAGSGVTPANAPATDDYGVLIGWAANRSVATATKLSNYIAIGYNAQAAKSNSCVLGNSSMTAFQLGGGVAEHADNAAAVTAGLAVGELYRTGDAVKVVHA